MRCATLLAVVSILAACATTPRTVAMQRAVEGPGAEEIWAAHFVQLYARAPTFTEQMAWKALYEEKVARFLNEHKELLTSPRASQLRFERRVNLGMTKAEVVLLLENPDLVSADLAAVATEAGQFSPQIIQRAKEVWSYPAGWRLYFADDEVVDITVKARAPLE